MNYELLIQEIQKENEHQIQQWQKEMMECKYSTATPDIPIKFIPREKVKNLEGE